MQSILDLLVLTPGPAYPTCPLMSVFALSLMVRAAFYAWEN